MDVLAGFGRFEFEWGEVKVRLMEKEKGLCFPRLLAMVNLWCLSTF